jgi:hypothetical protein
VLNRSLNQLKPAKCGKTTVAFRMGQKYEATSATMLIATSDVATNTDLVFD